MLTWADQAAGDNEEEKEEASNSGHSNTGHLNFLNTDPLLLGVPKTFYLQANLKKLDFIIVTILLGCHGDLIFLSEKYVRM